MASIDVRDRGNKVVGKVDVDAGVFERAVKPSVLHEAIVHLRAGARQGTHATKTRGEIRGSKRKPFRQKGTGRARAGDRRSPIWRKGGTTFGPQPRDHSTRFPRRKMKIALQMALSAMRTEDQIFVLESLAIDEAKTKNVATLLAGLGLEGRTLIYDPEADANLALAARNLPNAKVVSGRGLSVYDLLLHDNLLTSQDGIARIDEALR
ncbi:MAG: 50S ribosomal protein L4 [Acidobacteria bacterium]|nr:50S ribosomal protein L4 [Acidobacteriota bacterium]